MFYEKIFRKLAEKKIKYAVTGGVALVLHGIARFTADLDLIVELNENNLKKLIEAIKELGFKPRVPVSLEDLVNPEIRTQWISEKNMIVFTFYNPQQELEEIDIFVKEIIPFEEIERELQWIKYKDISIPVISINHLKKLKSLSGRPQDLADIEALQILEKLKEP